MSPGIIRVDHLQVAVPRALEKECLAFYRDALGLLEIAKPAELHARGGAWFQLSNLQLHVGLESEPSSASRRHVCFLVTNIAEARSHFKARGLAVEEDETVGSLQRFFIRDPAGNRIELSQEPRADRS